MKRPIKFRGQTVVSTYADGTPINNPSRTIYGEGVFVDPVYGSMIYRREHDGIHAIGVARDSIAQLVGYDKNGNEVYEGDEVIYTLTGATVKAEMTDIHVCHEVYRLKEATND